MCQTFSTETFCRNINPSRTFISPEQIECQISKNNYNKESVEGNTSRFICSHFIDEKGFSWWWDASLRFISQGSTLLTLWFYGRLSRRSLSLCSSYMYRTLTNLLWWSSQCRKSIKNDLNYVPSPFDQRFRFLWSTLHWRDKHP